jgi:hypothetical protein
MSTLEEDYRALKRLHDSANEAIYTLQVKNAELVEENNLILKKLVDCQNALDITKEIMRNALTTQNEIKDAYVIEIQDLKTKLALRG